MQSGQTTIYELFNGTKIFNIPKYQRSYAWGEKQLDDFIEDLKYQHPKKAYFLGTILFQLRSENGDFQIIDVVDGQQRITTIIIFMKILLDRMRELGADTQLLEDTFLKQYGEYKLRVLPADNTFFRDYILEENELVDGLISTPSQRRLLTAKTFLAERLGSFSQEAMADLRDKLKKTKVLTYVVKDTSDATLIFETTNDRGKGLTNLEKTKSFLMYKAYLAFPEPEVEIRLNDIQQYFSDLYRDYDQIQELMGEDSILQYHFIAFEKWSAGKTYKGYQHYVPEIKGHINKLIQTDRQQAGEFISRYSRELRESYSIMKTLRLNKDGYLDDLLAVNRPAMFWPLLLKAWKYDNSPDKRQFRRVVELAEIHAFRVIGIQRKRSNAGRTSFYAAARDFKGNFEKLIQHIKEIISWYTNDKEFRQRLLSSNFYRSIYGNDTRYLFWQYENYLRTKQPVATQMPFAAFVNTDHKTKLSIEHIAAQHPKDTIVADHSVLPEIDEEFQEIYLHAIGNLTFDPISANISKANNDVEVKLQKYFRRAPYKTQNELDDFLVNNRWGAESVINRGNTIADFALNRWDFQSV